MGQHIDRMTFSDGDYRAFREAMDTDLQRLRAALQRPGFGQGPGSFGAELEVYIVDADGSPLGRNIEIRDAMQDEQVTLELNRFNLEYNLTPVPMADRPFLSSERQMREALNAMDREAARFGGHVLPIGILPTLNLEDFDHRTMTDLPRYHALKEKLQKERDGLFRIDIQGADTLSLATDDITLEGANTSFQIHYRVSPERFADTFNAIQLVTPLVLAAAANSPVVFGRRLWHETRIPLFKKSIDSRSESSLDSLQWQQPARVNFGHGWLREGAYELFAEAVRLYPPLLPIIREPGATDQQDAPPGLHELRMQMGTIWLWNRPVYDDQSGGHLRIEMRSLPSGPTAVDMMANAALFIGLAEGLRDATPELITALPFRHATQNFYRAARQGMDASLVWPSVRQSGLQASNVTSLLAELLPVADEGLRAIGIDADERDRYLGIIDERLVRRRNGASWQLESLERLEETERRPRALRMLLQRYHELAQSNTPVAQWPLM